MLKFKINKKVSEILANFIVKRDQPLNYSDLYIKSENCIKIILDKILSFNDFVILIKYLNIFTHSNFEIYGLKNLICRNNKKCHPLKCMKCSQDIIWYVHKNLFIINPKWHEYLIFYEKMPMIEIKERLEQDKKNYMKEKFNNMLKKRDELYEFKKRIEIDIEKKKFEIEEFEIKRKQLECEITKINTEYIRKLEFDKKY